MPKRSRWPPPSPPLPTSNAAPAPIQLGKPFVRASLEPADSDLSLFYSNQATPKIANRLIALLAVEAPIQQREATIRVTQCWNSKAFCQKAHERLLTIASSLQQQQRLFRNDEDTSGSAAASTNNGRDSDFHPIPAESSTRCRWPNDGGRCC